MTASCGDYIDLDFRVINKGTRDDKVYVLVESRELKINEKTDVFELEKYGDRDTKKQSFSLKIPENVKDGKYKITASAVYGGEKDSESIEITLENCKKTTSETSDIEKVELNATNEEAVAKGTRENKLVYLIGSIMLVIILVIVVYVMWKTDYNKSDKTPKALKKRKK